MLRLVHHQPRVAPRASPSLTRPERAYQRRRGSSRTGVLLWVTVATKSREVRQLGMRSDRVVRQREPEREHGPADGDQEQRPAGAGPRRFQRGIVVEQRLQHLVPDQQIRRRRGRDQAGVEVIGTTAGPWGQYPSPVRCASPSGCIGRRGPSRGWRCAPPCWRSPGSSARGPSRDSPSTRRRPAAHCGSRRGMHAAPRLIWGTSSIERSKIENRRRPPTSFVTRSRIGWAACGAALTSTGKRSSVGTSRSHEGRGRRARRTPLPCQIPGRSR